MLSWFRRPGPWGTRGLGGRGAGLARLGWGKGDQKHWQIPLYSTAMSIGSTNTNFLEDMMTQHVVPASPSVKEFIDEIGLTSYHGKRLLNAIAMDDPEAYKSKSALERLFRERQKTDLNSQINFVSEAEARMSQTCKRSPRRLTTTVHEESDPFVSASEGSDDDINDAVSIAATYTLSKTAGSSGVTRKPAQNTPPLSSRTRGRSKVADATQKRTQSIPKPNPQKPQVSKRAQSTTSKQSSLLEQRWGSSP